ncbi:MAG: dihydroorotate dehydrogenase (quinone) [Deltaproteobacteria bacterium]|nr:MAG: dihydroorotate dehydrogenase (quinone) [Deltaproteobacteria bacterium]
MRDGQRSPVEGTVYRALIRPLLYLLPAETAHHFAFACLRLLAAIPGVLSLLRRAFHGGDEALRVRALGIDFPNPIGLAAGFDKDAIGYEALGAMGFGFIEVGTLTGQPQPGSPRPRLFRLPKDRALVNRMGFNNHGSADAVARLQRPHQTIVGVNIGKTKVVPEDDAIGDYVASAKRVAPLADYVVVNVSSPNTLGLRDLQATEKLRPLLSAVREALNEVSPARRVPLLVKIAPDLADEDIDAVADLSLGLGLDGIIATNTTIGRDGLASNADEVERCGAGGLSGPPVRERSLEVLMRLREKVGDELVLISVGGIETAEQAWERIQAGATLVQIYTAFIYEGPWLPSRLAKGVGKLAAATRRGA